MTYFVLLVFVIHTSISLLLGDDLACIFHNDLARLERSHSPNTVPAVFRSRDLNAFTPHVGLFLDWMAGKVSTFFPPFQFSKAAIFAKFNSEITVAGIALVSHSTIEAIFPATVFIVTLAFIPLLLILAPAGRRFTNKAIYTCQFCPMIISI